MTFRLVYPESYVKKAKKKFLRIHPEIANQYEKTLKLLEVNPQHPSLRLHGLSGRLSGLSSVSINISYRIVLDIVIKDKDIILIDVGNNDHVYR